MAAFFGQRLCDSGDVDLSHQDNVVPPSRSLIVDGNLNIFSCGNLQALTPKLAVQRAFLANDCINLTFLPVNVRKSGTAQVNNCRSLRSLPRWMVTGHRMSSIDVEGCHTAVINMALSHSWSFAEPEDWVWVEYADRMAHECDLGVLGFFTEWV